MNSLGEATCFEDLAFLTNCPELRAPLLAGDFQPSRFRPDSLWSYGKAIEVAFYRVRGSRSAVRFFIHPCETDAGTRWQAWGDWCEYGRTASDACYDFLDGGGSFASRATAEWAIHLYVSRLLAEDASAAARAA